MESEASYAEMVNDRSFQQVKNNEAALRNQTDITFEATHLKQSTTDKSTVM
jgi:hypothetical protein